MLGTILVCSVAMLLAGLGSVALTPREGEPARNAGHVRRPRVARDGAAGPATLQPGAG